MFTLAEEIPETTSGNRSAEYEQPLTERMRTFLRLEFLYQQMLFHSETESDWSSRAAISSLLEITAILMRGDVRSELMKELERQIEQLRRYQSQPGVDAARLQRLLNNLMQLRTELGDVGPHYLQPIKDSEFLSAIKHRSAIPGGTCEFDLPDYSHWLGLPYQRRLADLDRWIRVLRPLCDTVMELMWLAREGANVEDRVANSGMYQYSIGKDVPCRLLRVIVLPGCPFYPEISGSPQRFTIRFMQWSDTENRAVQTQSDVRFQISTC